MKKTLLLTAVAIVAITGCSKNEVTYQKPQEDNALTFRTVIGKQTKATEATATTMAADENGYKSIAYVTPVDISSFEGPFDQYFTENIKSTAGVWGASKTLYWPTEGKMSIFSYYPSEDKNLTTINYVSGPQKPDGTFYYPTINFGVSNVLADQVDLLAAVNLNEVQKNPVEPVAVAFSHILSQLYFKAKTSDDSYKVKVKKISVLGALSNASFTYSDNVTNPPMGSWRVDNYSSQEYGYRTSVFPTEAYDYIGTFATKVESEGNAGSLMIIPQTASNDFKLEVTYDIYTATGYLLTADIKKTAQMEELEQGKKYAYVLTLPIDAEATTPITFTTTVGDWDSEVSIEQSFAKYTLAGTEDGYAGAIADLVGDFNTYRNGLTGNYRHSINVVEDTDKTITQTLTIDLTSVASVNLGTDDIVVLDFSKITTLTDAIKVVITAGNNWEADIAELTAAGKITLKKKAVI